MRALSSYQIPVHLENDANCVGLSELTKLIQNLKMQRVVIGTGLAEPRLSIGDFTEVATVWVGNWLHDNSPAWKAQQLVATSRQLEIWYDTWLKIWSDWLGRSQDLPRGRKQMPFAKKPLSAWTVIWRKACSISSIWLIQISVWEALSVKSRLLSKVFKSCRWICRNQWRIHGRTCHPSLHLSCRCQSLWYPWLQEENQWLRNWQTSASYWSIIKNHISLPDVEVASRPLSQASLYQGEEWSVSIDLPKPYQLYRALSLVGNCSSDKVEIEEQAAYEDLAYGRLFSKCGAECESFCQADDWVLALMGIQPLSSSMEDTYQIESALLWASVSLLSWGIRKSKPMPRVWYYNCAFTFRPWPLIGRFVK